MCIRDSVKMSKSLGNAFTVQDVLERGYRASTLRYGLLSVHYRKQLRFTWGSLDQAEEALKRLMGCLSRLDAVIGGEEHPALTERIDEACLAFDGKLAQDLNIPGALGIMFELVRAINTAIDDGDLGAPDVAIIRNAFDRFDCVLGVIALRRTEDERPAVAVEEIEQLIAERRAARGRRDFAAADGIRDDLDVRGIILEDTPDGTRWKRK